MMPEYCFVSSCCGASVTRTHMTEEGYWFRCSSCLKNCGSTQNYHHSVYLATNRKHGVESLINVLLEHLRVDENKTPEELAALKENFMIQAQDNDLLRLYCILNKWCWIMDVECGWLKTAYNTIVIRHIDGALEKVRQDMMKVWKVR